MSSLRLFSKNLGRTVAFHKNKGLLVVCSGVCKDTQVASVKNYKPPPDYSHVEFPPGEKRRLGVLMKAPPPPPGQRPPKLPKAVIDMRGPELIHNKLIHKQYGIRALQGGALHHGHNEMLRMGILRKIDEKRMFAIWRVDAPWKPVTKKGVGKTLGGGKGNIDHYETPVKAGRIIIEVGGYMEYQEVYPLLWRLAQKLPFKAEPICQADLDNEIKTEKYLAENNMNPFTFEYCLKNNFMGSGKWASPYDYIWHGKYH